MDNTASTHFPDNLPAGWRSHLADEAGKDYFCKLTEFLRGEHRRGEVIYPPREKVLRAIQALDYDAVKVVILGQDPYHGPSQAVGLSFAVPNDLKPKPPSLINIFKELESEMGVALDRGQSELTGWVAQGVLLLNTVLTVRRAQAFSHRNQGWENFTDLIIRRLNDRKNPVVFILWGAAARKKKELITGRQHGIIESAHPSPLSAHNGFFGSRPFSKANALLKQWGQSPIDWTKTG
jgi:uracil-DNA glycosylase